METKYKKNYLEFENLIIETHAFRILSKKTQVFFYRVDENIENRVTHTTKVAASSQIVAQKLGLNDSLAKAIAIGHDVGHVPYGHAGERTLNKLTEEVGGFRHNEQSIRVLTMIEPIQDIPSEVLEGILKHSEVKHPERFKEFNPNQPCSTYEGQIVSIIDEIVTLETDLYDGLQIRLLENRSIDEILQEAENIHKNLRFLKKNEHVKLRERLIDDLIVYSNSTGKITLSSKMEELQKKIRKFIFENCIKSYKVARSDARGDYLIKKLFEGIETNVSIVENEWRVKFKEGKDPKKRVIADYIANLSDEGAEQLFKELFDLYRG